MKILFFILLNFIGIVSNGNPENGNELQINFRHFVGSDSLIFKTKEYVNELGQKYTVTKFKYYISNIQLINDSGKVFSSEEYFLINEDEPQSKGFSVKDVPPGNYKTLSFIIGVDSLRNCSGLQEGALDPVKGMFWAWNTGYIFLKLEGTSESSTAQGGIFEYHIGGFKEPVNAIRKISLEMDSLIFADEVPDSKKIFIKADISQILKQPVSIDFSTMPVVSDMTNAELVANNYSDMFSLIKEK
ncbi:MAG: hypothetical protein IPL24_04840 [Bacteroidetes bacterium]|nr:hypothetical protein [Bacteroidota bacterium]